MNFDVDNDKISDSQICNPLPTSIPKFPTVDMVDWASSQPAALKSLLSATTKEPERHPVRHHSEGSRPLHQVRSTATEPQQARSRPLRRTNSSARARLGPEVASTSFNPPPVPDGDFWSKDRNTILAACQNVSERMDESAFLAAKTVEGAPGARKSKAHHVNDVPKGRRTPYSVTHAREGASRWEKGKQRAHPIPDPKASSLHSVFTPLYEEQQSESSRTTSIEPSIAETSLMDIDLCDTPPLTLPLFDTPLTKRNHTTFTRTTSSSSTSSASTDTSGPVTPVSLATSAPPVQLHPLLTQKHPPKQQASKTNRTSLTSRQPSVPPPPLSQSNRPRALGMRRVHAVPTNAAQVLPTKQKPFRPPLLSQASAATRAVSIPPPPQREKVDFDDDDPDRSCMEIEPTCSISRSPSPDVSTDANTSFGDVSLGMDVEELELTMRQYD
ncbi:hypothetical protein H0H92_005018 [Tricholoma furcatifolium]|nr:hypothetical protein H0H92_005018 [Tricholoma furcatifolium]